MRRMEKYTKIEDRLGFVGRESFTTRKIKIQTNFGARKLNSVAKAAILDLLAGYCNKEDVTIFGDDLSKFIPNFDDFASLNINIINAGPRDFKMKLKFYPEKGSLVGKIDNRLKFFDTILMMSGGIDSVSGLFYSLDKNWRVLPLWVDFGQKNKINENKTILQIEKKLKIPVLKVRIDIGKFVSKGWKVWKYGIIPARNFMLISLASLFIEMSPVENFKILLCATRDEYNARHQDKSPTFFKTISKLLSKSLNKNIEVLTPFDKYNKTELIKYWSKEWLKKYGFRIKDTISCYTNNFCGECPACYNRNIYGSAAGYLEDIKCKVDPFKDQSRMIQNYHLCNFDTWDKTRKIDFLIALSHHSQILPSGIKTFLEQQKSKYYKQIEKRLTFLENIRIN